MALRFIWINGSRKDFIYARSAIPSPSRPVPSRDVRYENMFMRHVNAVKSLRNLEGGSTPHKFSVIYYGMCATRGC